MMRPKRFNDLVPCTIPIFWEEGGRSRRAAGMGVSWGKICGVASFVFRFVYLMGYIIFTLLWLLGLRIRMRVFPR